MVAANNNINSDTNKGAVAPSAPGLGSATAPAGVERGPRHGRLMRRTLTRGESVRGPKESSEEDDKPMLPPPAPAPERKSLLGNLFGGGKK